MRIYSEQDIINFQSECLSKARRRKRRCLTYGCKEEAINSHVFWKSGILRPISEQSHLMELNHERVSRGEEPKFCLTGINKILSFKGFCNKHDNKIFAPIENDSADYSNMRSQILLSIRGVYHELRKKEINIDSFECLLRNKILPLNEHDLKNMIYIQELGVKDLKFYASELNREYRDPRGRFIFKCFKLPYIPIVSSSIFSLDSDKTMSLKRQYDENWEAKPLNSLLFNLFPYKGYSMLILGFHSNYLKNFEIANKINQMNRHENLKLVSDILIERVESWACNPQFYHDNIKPIEDQVLSDSDKDPEDFNGTLSAVINIFQEISFN